MYLCACLFRRQEGCCDIRFIQKNARAEQGRTCNTYLSCSKSLGISALYISEDLDENYGAYDFIYKYRPEKRNFLLLIFVHEWSCRNGT